MYIHSIIQIYLINKLNILLYNLYQKLKNADLELLEYNLMNIIS